MDVSRLRASARGVPPGLRPLPVTASRWGTRIRPFRSRCSRGSLWIASQTCGCHMRTVPSHPPGAGGTPVTTPIRIGTGAASAAIRSSRPEVAITLAYRSIGARVMHRLDGRPRTCLNWRRPKDRIRNPHEMPPPSKCGDASKPGPDPALHATPVGCFDTAETPGTRRLTDTHPAARPNFSKADPRLRWCSSSTMAARPPLSSLNQNCAYPQYVHLNTQQEVPQDLYEPQSTHSHYQASESAGPARRIQHRCNNRTFVELGST